MYGPVEVEQVTHHFSPETGFVTTIVPDLMCYVNNIIQQGSSLTAGAYQDEVTKIVSKARFFARFITPFFANKVANVAFWLTGLTQNRREPISLTPLMYSGRPYIAGIQGLRKSTLYEAIDGHIYRFITNKERVFKYTALTYDRLVDLWAKRGRNWYRGEY
jgi:hypothetical protein